MTVLLGIDPGSRVTGYGVIQAEAGRVDYLDSGCIRMSTVTMPVRLGEIFTGVTTLIDRYRPVELAIEQVFLARNADSALKLGQARGAAIAAAVSRGLPVAEYSARQIKQAVVGKGAAEKQQVQHMVRELLRLERAPASDAADALAAAICHAHTLQSGALLLLQSTDRSRRARSRRGTALLAMHPARPESDR